MPLLPTLGRTVGTGVKAARLLVRGSLRGGAWATRRVGSARARGAANEVGMIRLFDLHAVSCAGDALIAIGLAGTIFSVPLGEARSKVGLYLLITMVPFALLAPVVGPLLDHFRHGRRYALATTFLGRAFLAYILSDNLASWVLYPAAFGVLALSRAYGVARSAAVPRLLPAGVGLSQVGARASVYGTFAGILVAPIGLLAFKFGPQWPLRVATVIFIVGMVVALRLPPRADSDPPEALPRAWRAILGIGRGTDRPLSGKLVVATLIGSSSLRLLYGFLLLFLTFAIMGGQLDTSLAGLELSRGATVGLVGGALALGTFISTAAGTGLRIRRPLALQSSGLIVTAGVAVLTTIFYHVAMVTLLALVTAIFSGIAKLAVDASIQERVPERQRATAFAHSETALMLAWVTGGGLGIIPFAGRLGIGFAALLAVLAAVRAVWSATRLHNERLSGRPDATAPDIDPPSGSAAPENSHNGTENEPGNPAAGPADRPYPDLPEPDQPEPDQPEPGRSGSEHVHTGHGGPGRPAGSAGTNPPAQRRPADDGTQRLDSRTTKGRRWWGGKRKLTGLPEAGDGPDDRPVSGVPETGHVDRPANRPGPSPDAFADGTGRSTAPPGFHVYRPSSASRTGSGDPTTGDDS